MGSSIKYVCPKELEQLPAYGKSDIRHCQFGQTQMQSQDGDPHHPTAASPSSSSSITQQRCCKGAQPLTPCLSRIRMLWLHARPRPHRAHLTLL
jgi:hypothetical protein